MNVENVNFDKFLWGESGIELESLEEAKKLYAVCEKNNIDCDYYKPEHYQDEPYWYIKDKSLEITRYISDMCDECCDVWNFKDFCENHC